MFAAGWLRAPTVPGSLWPLPPLLVPINAVLMLVRRGGVPVLLRGWVSTRHLQWGCGPGRTCRVVRGRAAGGGVGPAAPRGAAGGGRGRHPRRRRRLQDRGGGQA